MRFESNRGNVHTSAIEQTTQRKAENRQPDYVVRAKTGPGYKEWSTVGFAWKRDKGEGVSVKLHSMPISPHWNGVLKLLPPYAADDASDATGEMFPWSERPHSVRPLSIGEDQIVVADPIPMARKQPPDAIT